MSAVRNGFWGGDEAGVASASGSTPPAAKPGANAASPLSAGRKPVGGGPPDRDRVWRHRDAESAAVASPSHPGRFAQSDKGAVNCQHVVPSPQRHGGMACAEANSTAARSHGHSGVGKVRNRRRARLSQFKANKATSRVQPRRAGTPKVRKGGGAIVRAPHTADLACRAGANAQPRATALPDHQTAVVGPGAAATVPQRRRDRSEHSRAAVVPERETERAASCATASSLPQRRRDRSEHSHAAVMPERETERAASCATASSLPRRRRDRSEHSRAAVVVERETGLRQLRKIVQIPFRKPCATVSVEILRCFWSGKRDCASCAR